jgi:hypothetical protein
MKFLCFSVLSFFVLFLGSCKKNNSASNGVLIFDSIPTAKPVTPIIEEGSGLADSKLNPGYLWVEQDSGNPPEVQLMKNDGTVVRKIYIKGAVNRDWEEMILSGTDIYIGDIGDNNKVYPGYSILKFTEPSLSADTVRNFETIRFQYPDGSHDAESFLVDPFTKDIYLITKTDNPSRIYRIAFPYSNSSMNMASLAGSLAYSGVTGGSISNNGSEIIVRTYTSLYYYARASGESISQCLQKGYTNLPYKVEPQGEAVAFARDSSGFFTLSERGLSASVNLYFYKRK